VKPTKYEKDFNEFSRTDEGPFIAYLLKRRG